jgi:hypothetical protein
MPEPRRPSGRGGDRAHRQEVRSVLRGSQPPPAVGSPTAPATRHAPILPPSPQEPGRSRKTRRQGYRTLGGRARFIYATPLAAAGDQPVGAIAMLQDASPERAEWTLGWPCGYLGLALVAPSSSRFGGSPSWPLAEISQWTRALRRPVPPPTTSPTPISRPLAPRSPTRAQHAAGPGRGRAGGPRCGCPARHLTEERLSSSSRCSSTTGYWSWCRRDW